MLVCLIEAETNIIKPLVGKLTKNFPTEYIVHIRSKKLEANELNMLKHKPLLCSQWCVVIHCDKFSRDTAIALAKDNLVIWQVENKHTAVSIKGSSKDIQVIDNSRLAQDDVIAWIQKELAVYNEAKGKVTTVNEKTAKYLYRRVDGYIDYLVQAVNVLKYELRREEHYTLTKDLIDRYVTKVSPVKRYHVLNALLGQECNYSREMITVYLSRGLYEWKSLKEYILKEIENYKRVFEYEMSGELSLTNILEFLKENNTLEMTDSKIKGILLAHRSISYERLIFLESFITSLPNDALGACRFCSFVRAIMSTRA